jgi:hypothetical protein
LEGAIFYFTTQGITQANTGKPEMSRNAPSRRSARNRSIRHRRQDSSHFRLLRHEQLEDRRLLSFVYSDFADSSEFSLLGAAAVTEDHILRVAPSTDGTGAAWHSEQQFVSLGFETTFQFRMGARFESRNGMAFVIQNVSATAIGGSIGGLGYSGLPNSLAIEFDTDSNWTLEDPSDSHISVHTRGVDPNSKKEFYSLGSISTSGYTLNDGNVHTAKLIYSPGQLSVFVDDMNAPQLSVPLDLASTIELNRGQAWVGFTAASLSTKGQNHDVLSWNYESPADANH